MVDILDYEMEIQSFNTVVVGTGAAGYNACDRLYSRGQKDVAIVTEGKKKGTSRNTGSDKQTYYKLTLAGRAEDSIHEMAETLCGGGAMHGDLALVEAALSPRAFFRLVDIGVPFPHNRFGEYVGYKTDHDPRQRATSAGPLTSKLMTEGLEREVKKKGIPLFDGYQVIGILTTPDGEKSLGLLALNLNRLEEKDKRFILFNCTNIIYATGGPAGMYATSVYPESQSGATGLAFEAGVEGKNLTESQFGLASIKFRWNLSGTYQQVLPRYISTAQDGGDEREFLKDYFPGPRAMLDAVFLKGYQWPFDPEKITDYGSSLIDILVYNERINKGRRVWLDYTENPSWARDGNRDLDFSLLGKEAYTYLENSDALFGTPIDRLAHMNQPAIDLYAEHGIDLETEYLEIAVCAQHNNGGLFGDIWWQSNIDHFFPIGEVNGTHGVYRPGGSALNSGQVGGIRAAQYISTHCGQDPLNEEEFIKAVSDQVKSRVHLAEQFMTPHSGNGNVDEIRQKLGRRMSERGAHIRSLEGAKKGAEEAKRDLEKLAQIQRIGSLAELGEAFRNYDLLVAQYVYLRAIENYIEEGGKSRGSYLVRDPKGRLPVPGLSEEFRFSLDEGASADRIQRVGWNDGTCRFSWHPVRPVPQDESWFEKVWNAFRRDEIVGS